MKTEFEFERGEILSNLTLLEDHGFKAPCPYCMEKHESKIIGYAEEIAAGKEGDEATLVELAETMRKVREVTNEGKTKQLTDQEYASVGEIARQWRRKLQGAKDHSHADTIEKHVITPCVGAHCQK
jgi:Fe2+ transport system protein B